MQPHAPLLLALTLAACAGKHDSGDSTPRDSDSDPVDSHDSAPETGCPDTATAVPILSPADGALFVVGDTVPLETESWVTTATWSIDGAVVAEAPSGSWTAVVGTHTAELTGSGDDPCTSGASTSTFTVVEASVEVYGAELGLDTLTWHGLSAGLDGTLWASSSAGLVHLDPTTDPPTARTYTTADGLYTDSPYGVLAHSDGTLWVGDVGDTTRQGSHFTVEADGTLTLIEIIDYTESEEIQYALRLREQPYGVGAGDVWMGTNEGICLWDADLGVFSEHAHPTHPHSLTYGVAFTADASIWNGDQYQVSRWEYSNDGNLSPSAMESGGDLAEYWVPWPVDVEEMVYITDIDANSGDPYTGESTLWLASSVYGVARVDVGGDVGTSTTTLLGDPFPTSANAVRADPDGNVWIGGASGLQVWSATTETMTDLTAYLPGGTVTQVTIDPDTLPPTAWVGTSAGIVRFAGVP